MPKPRLDIWFGPESYKLLHYSKGWAWHREVDDDGDEFWELRPPTLPGVSSTRDAARVHANGVISMVDPMCPSAIAHTTVPHMHPPRTGWSLVTAGMRFAVGYIVENGWARVWDPVAPLRPLVTSGLTDDGFVELQVGMIQLQLTEDEAEAVLRELPFVLAKLRAKGTTEGMEP